GQGGDDGAGDQLPDDLGTGNRPGSQHPEMTTFRSQCPVGQRAQSGDIARARGTSSSPSTTSAARSSDAASSTVSDRPPGPISRILPSARSRATRSGGGARPASTSGEPTGT